MTERISYEKMFLDAMMENEENGVIFLDRNGIIKGINRTGRIIVGLTVEDIHPHPAGKIENGDIVIICDSEIGGDDGGLCPEDLKIVGVSDKRILPGSAIVLIGEYGTGKRAAYKYRSKNTLGTELILEETVLGKRITAAIDEKKRFIEVNIDGESIHENYMETYGHLVVLDGKTGEIKFLQANGYSIRNEYVKNILEGETFAEKTKDLKTNVDNSAFITVFPDNNCADDLRLILSGEIKAIKNKIYKMNKRPLAISMIPVENENNEPEGVFIKIADLLSLDTALKSRDNLLSVLETERKEIFSLDSDTLSPAFGDVLGNGIEMRAVKILAKRAARRKINVLITGESGTGKSFLAREIYREGGSEGPFVYVNCAAIAPTLFESEMFGYVGGAFTGANSKGSMGYFESANGGTIFLDEIGEIPMTVQVKLLNVIQNKEICRVGSAKVIPINVRIIAATNMDLEKEVEKERFRKDLYYRLNVFNIEMPPLRNCKDDLMYMSKKFLEQACENNDLGEKILSQDAVYKIMSYNWPGNVRELQNVIERAAVFCDDYIIYPEYIKINSEAEKYDFKTHMRNEEIRVIKESLRRNNGDKKQALAELGLSRSTFYSKLKEYEIE